MGLSRSGLHVNEARPRSISIFNQIEARMTVIPLDKRQKAGAPRHLRPPTQAWFRDVMEAYELEKHHIRLLTLACESWDRGELAREALAEHGMTFTDRFGAPHARPEVAVARDATIAFARLLRELDLDTEQLPPPSGRRPPALKSNRRGA
jgi:phage terminase small subunit